MDSDRSPVDQSASALTDLVPVNGDEVTAVAPLAHETEDLDSYNFIEPPPLDWRSDSSSEVGSAEDLDYPTLSPLPESLEKNSLGGSVLPLLDARDILTPPDANQQEIVGHNPKQVQEKAKEKEEDEAAVVTAEGFECDEEVPVKNDESSVCVEEVGFANRTSAHDEDHSRIHSLLSQLQLMGEEPHQSRPTPPHCHYSELEACGPSLLMENSTETTGLLFSESHQRDLLGLLQCTEISATPHPTRLPHRGEVDAVVSVSYNQEDVQRFWGQYGNGQQQRFREDSLTSLPDDEYPEPVWMKLGEDPPDEEAAAESEQVGGLTIIS